MKNIIEISIKYIVNILFILLAISFSFYLIESKYAARVYNLLRYISVAFFFYTIIASCFSYKKTKSYCNEIYLFIFLLSIFLLGFSQYIWATTFENPGYDYISGPYKRVGKLLMALPFIIFLIYKNKSSILKITYQISSIFLFTGSVLLLIFSAIESYSTGTRVIMNAGVATTSAYIMVFYSLCSTILLIHSWDNRYIKIIGVSIIFITSTISISLTETRGAVLSIPLVFIFVFYLYLKDTLIKYRYMLLTLFLIFTSISTFMSWDRIARSYTEISSYSINNNTSIGARFSMWKAGVHSGTQSPLGQTVNQRNAYSVEYIVKHEKSNPEALRASKYHFHNESIDRFSLQGYIGLAIIFFFYVCCLLIPIVNKEVSSSLYFIIIPMILYQQVDVLFLQADVSLSICISFIFCISIRHFGYTSRNGESEI